MTDFIDVFGAFDFLVRESLILLLVAFSVYLLLRAGMFAVPQVGFMAVGGYTAAILSSNYDIAMVLRLPAAGIAGALVGLALGLMLARLDGIYLAIATIGFSEIVRIVARNLEITGGAPGLSGLDRSLPDVLIVALVIAVAVALWRLQRTRFGLAMTVIREDPLTAAHQGVNLRRYRAALFAGSGLIAGVAGALHIHLRGFIEPGLFSFDLLVTLLTATVVGGMNTVWGPVIGGVVIFSLPEVLRGVEEFRNLVNGALLVLVMAFAPSGLVEVPGRLGRRLRPASAAAPGRPTPAAVSADIDPEVAQTVLWLARDPSGTAASGNGTAATGPGTATTGSGEEAQAVLEVGDLSKRFGGLVALSDVELTVWSGEVLGVIGPNGSGKTTLLNMLSGVYTPDSGSGHVLGQPLERSWGRPEQLAQAGVARTFQTIRLLEGRTVRENVTAGAHLRQHTSVASALLGLAANGREVAAVHQRVEAALELVGLDDLVDVEADTLPYGLQRRVEIARALVHGPGLLLLDEPTAGMTPAERDDIFALIGTVQTLGVGVIVVEHDVQSMTDNCDRIAVLDFGVVIAQGDPTTVIREEAVVDAYIGRRARS